MPEPVNTYDGGAYSLTLAPDQEDISQIHLLHYNVSLQLVNATVAETGASGALSADEQAKLEHLQFWVNAVLTNLTAALGLVGNILTVVILSKRAMRSSTNIYLSVLALWDCVVLLASVLLIGLPSIPQLQGYVHYVLAYVISYFYPLALIAQTATIWLTVSFTVERYIAVCHPLKAARMCTIHRAKLVIGGVSLGSGLYNLPRWFEYRPGYVPNQSHPVALPTPFGQNETYNKVYFSWLYLPIMCIVPLLTLAVMNLFLILAVRKSHRQRRDMNVRQSRENNVTIMLVSVVIVFIICQVPALVYNLMFAIHRRDTQASFAYKMLSEVRNFLVGFNSAINFLLYCALGQKFRRIFLHTFFRRCISESYMPMSGVHHAATTVSVGSQRRFVARGHDYRGRPLTGNSHTSSSTLPTTCPSSQESSLISPGHLSPVINHGCEVHTYTTLKDKRRGRVQNHTESDDDTPYEHCLMRDGEKETFPLYRTNCNKPLWRQ